MGHASDFHRPSCFNGDMVLWWGSLLGKLDIVGPYFYCDVGILQCLHVISCNASFCWCTLFFLLGSPGRSIFRSSWAKGNIVYQTSNLHVDMGVFRVNYIYTAPQLTWISAFRCQGNTPTGNLCPSNIKGHIFKGRARDQKRHIVLNHLLTLRHGMCWVNN